MLNNDLQMDKQMMDDLAHVGVLFESGLNLDFRMNKDCHDDKEIWHPGMVNASKMPQVSFLEESGAQDLNIHNPNPVASIQM